MTLLNDFVKGSRILLLSILTACFGGHLPAAAEYDLVIYGGTSAGVAAAVQAKRMGKTVVVIEPGHRLGGLSSGVLGQTDIGNKAAIGGIAREFYQAVRRHYDDPSAWKWQRHQEYEDDGQTRTTAGELAMWTFEPSVALKIFNDWAGGNRIDVVYGERLNRLTGVSLTRSIPWRIMAIAMESGKVFRGRMFIDATYEGDLMAAAKVSYTVGREANSQYGETANGVQTLLAKAHQLFPGIDPYLKPGDPRSGLLPHIDPKGPGEEGGADKRVQAYCFRMCLTDHPDNRIPFARPEGYNPLWYELLLRNFEAGERRVPWINSAMPNRKTDTNNKHGVSTDFIGQNYDYPEASYAEREEIVARHRLYQQGLMWTLANNPRVPEAVRREVARWGMTKDEFVEGHGWQDQIYVREARRMVSDYVMTQNNCEGKAVADDPVALAAYTMDSHNQQRYVDARGHVRNEGDVQIKGFPPYPISYKSIVPSARECANLLVPTCLSASHIAFGSIRMEPVFMVLGQSAATAAAQAIDGNRNVQDIDYARLRDQLIKDRQVLAWPGPRDSKGKH
ncbi:MAG: FAD-dependent oxidoreductase [Opitutaceae bacterium]|nr:FAD-dependent oxidoreductase [Opitutaceae bacterium]